MRGWFIWLGVAAFAGAPGVAADKPAIAAPIAADEGTIVVTAQLRRQNALDVPFALTAYSGDFLEKLGITEFDRLSAYVPGLLVQNQSPNNPAFVIRGITSDSNAAFNEPRISVFEDGVSISKSPGAYVELFDLDRVEIAKGPQSTLYGRGALIGAINVIEAKADPSAPAMTEYLSYGNFNAIRVDGMANLPLGDGMALRLAGRYKIRDGTIANLLGGDDYNSQNSGALRASFHADVNADLGFDLIGNYQNDAPSGTSFKSIAYLPTDPRTGAPIGTRSRTSGAALAAAAGFEGGRPLGLRRNLVGVKALASWNIDTNLTLSSITGWRKFHTNELFDADGISLASLTAGEEARGTQASQELRLTYESKVITLFIGGSYFHEKGSVRTPVAFNEAQLLARAAGALNGGGAVPGLAADNPAPAALFASPAFTGRLVQGFAAARGVNLTGPLAQAIAANLRPDHLETSTNYARSNSVDLFGDATLHLGDRFDLGAGLRYSHDDKRSGISAAVANRSVLAGLIAAVSQPQASQRALLQALATPGAGAIPTSPTFPVPMFGLGFQPTANNGDALYQSASNGGFAFRATARYKPADNGTLYLTYARGRRPRILSVATPTAPGAAPIFEHLPAEIVDSYEVGAKTSLLDHRLSVDGAAFYYRYSNFGTVVQQGTQFLNVNAGRADSFGFEGQIGWQAADWIRFFANYSYNHSRFKSGAFRGNHFRLSPDNAGALGATLGRRTPDGAGFDLTPSVALQSKEFFDDNNDRPDLQQAQIVPDNVQDEVQKGFALVNLRAGYSFPGRHLRVELWADNLLDKRYIKDAGNTGDTLGLPTFIAGSPRFYGVGLSYKF
ncbi:TonB-dependent receptor [Sphingomonas crusticola]|uniref:TonB-dependent receptor n=1 Tax=Sphingomonas crusticola TaxID=1697973 RepID=UPI000E22C4F0|nr:TonB-dependent receptor [Sphingomonas crusticola]